MNLEKMLHKIEGKTILVTGATGLIGQSIIKYLLQSIAGSTIKIIALVRDEEKAKKIYAGVETDKLQILVSDICLFQPREMEINYIIHGANQTSSKRFVSEPVETIMTALCGTRNMLELARLNRVESFVYLSSMEVYGAPESDEKITEEHPTNLNTMMVRSCYPESKRMCENLCASYVKEFNVPAKVIRLTQTFGPGVEYNDTRVFAEFARCIIEGRNIVLNTKGETKRNYLYIDDAVTAILTVLIDGQIGEAYNAANENTYCSIYEMACYVACECIDKKIEVIIKENNTDMNELGYAPTLHMNLDTKKLRNLGWSPTVNIREMYANMIKCMKNT